MSPTTTQTRIRLSELLFYRCTQCVHRIAKRRETDILLAQEGFCFSVRGEERVQVSARWEALRCEHVPTNIVHLPREHETKKKKPPKRRHAGDMSLRQGMSRWNRAEPF
jgi:hypothetical protein